LLFLLLAFLTYSSILKMEALCSTETSVNSYQTSISKDSAVRVSAFRYVTQIVYSILLQFVPTAFFIFSLIARGSVVG
jgi:hypothetical protein